MANVRNHLLPLVKFANRLTMCHVTKAAKCTLQSWTVNCGENVDGENFDTYAPMWMVTDSVHSKALEHGPHAKYTHGGAQSSGWPKLPILGNTSSCKTKGKPKRNRKGTDAGSRLHRTHPLITFKCSTGMLHTLSWSSDTADGVLSGNLQIPLDESLWMQCQYLLSSTVFHCLPLFSTVFHCLPLSSCLPPFHRPALCHGVCTGACQSFVIFWQPADSFEQPGAQQPHFYKQRCQKTLIPGASWAVVNGEKVKMVADANNSIFFKTAESCLSNDSRRGACSQNPRFHRESTSTSRIPPPFQLVQPSVVLKIRTSEMRKKDKKDSVAKEESSPLAFPTPLSAPHGPKVDKVPFQIWVVWPLEFANSDQVNKKSTPWRKFFKTVRIRRDIDCRKMDALRAKLSGCKKLGWFQRFTIHPATVSPASCPSVYRVRRTLCPSSVPDYPTHSIKLSDAICLNLTGPSSGGRLPSNVLLASFSDFWILTNFCAFPVFYNLLDSLGLPQNIANLCKFVTALACKRTSWYSLNVACFEDFDWLWKFFRSFR